MRNLCLLFIYTICLAACTSKQKEPESENMSAAQQAVMKEEENFSEANSPALSEKPTAPEQFIIPGKSIGLIKLNEDAEVVQKLLGEPSTSNAGMGKSLQTWNLKTADGKTYQLSIFFSRNMGNNDEKSRAKQIRVTSAAYMTKKQEAATTSTLRSNIQEAKKTVVYTLPGSKGQFEVYDNVPAGIAFEFDPP